MPAQTPGRTWKLFRKTGLILRKRAALSRRMGGIFRAGWPILRDEPESSPQDEVSGTEGGMSVAQPFFVIPAKHSARRDREGTGALVLLLSRPVVPGSPVPDLRCAASGMTMEKWRRFGGSLLRFQMHNTVPALSRDLHTACLRDAPAQGRGSQADASPFCTRTPRLSQGGLP